MKCLILLKENSSLRYLWLAQLISSIGDWFNYVAIISLVMEMTGSGLQVALTIFCRTVPVLFLGPWSGVLADRLNKKWIMIGTDLVRTALALGYILIDSPADLWIVYLLSSVLSVGTIFFDSARLSYLPQVITKDKLLIANNIYSFTFGLTIATGAMLGGWAIGLLGYRIAFIFNALSFFFSAFLLHNVKSIKRGERKEHLVSWKKELLTTYRWIKNTPLLFLLILADASLAIGSGLMNVLLGVFALKVFAGGSLAMGLLYNSLGWGFVLGSFFTNKIKIEGLRKKFLCSTWMLIGIGVSLIFFSQAPNLIMATCSLIFTYFFQGIFGVLYNTLFMILTPHAIQGKVFALDRSKLLTVMSSTILLGGWFLEFFSPRMVGLGTGIFVFLAGICWVIIFSKLLVNSLEKENSNEVVPL